MNQSAALMLSTSAVAVVAVLVAVVVSLPTPISALMMPIYHRPALVISVLVPPTIARMVLQLILSTASSILLSADALNLRPLLLLLMRGYWSSVGQVCAGIATSHSLQNQNPRGLPGNRRICLF